RRAGRWVPAAPEGRCLGTPWRRSAGREHARDVSHLSAWGHLISIILLSVYRIFSTFCREHVVDALYHCVLVTPSFRGCEIAVRTSRDVSLSKRNFLNEIARKSSYFLR